MALRSRKDGELEAGLAFEPRSLEQGAAGGALALGPAGEAVLVDQVDGVGGPAAVGLEEGGEVGHGCAIAGRAAVTGVNPVTSVGFGFADTLAGSRALFALARDCSAIAHLRSALKATSPVALGRTGGKAAL